MAMMGEVVQRMLTKRPSVARTSQTGSWCSDRSPTRAREPRTEITRPKDVTVLTWLVRSSVGAIIPTPAGETVKSCRFRLSKISLTPPGVPPDRLPGRPQDGQYHRKFQDFAGHPPRTTSSIYVWFTNDHSR